MGITMYTTPTCGYCFQLKSYLRQRGIPFAEHDVSQDPHRAKEMVRLSGQQGVPVSIVDGQVVLGADIPQINDILVQRTKHPPRLGVSIADAAQIAAKRGVQLPAGAYVGRVRPASSAALAGLQVGDVIVQLAGQATRSAQDVHRVTASLHYDQPLDLVVWRDGQRIAVRSRA
jgi:S1-C subfamily serine protease